MAWGSVVATLFPPAPPHRRRHPTAYLAAFAAAVAAQLLTPAGLTRLTHVWAEDGARFGVDALTRPLWRNLGAPYGGYLHTVPRLLAELVSLLPLSWAPAAFAVSAAMVRAGIALLVFAASGGYLRSRPVRLAHAALVVLLPATNSEALGNLTNLHWFLLYAAFWALLWRPASRAAAGLAALVVLLAAVSSPLVIVLAPLAVLRLTLPAWPDRWGGIVFCAGSVLQTLAVLTATRVPYSTQAADPVQVILASVLRVPVAAFTGSEAVDHLYPGFGNIPALVALLLAGVPIGAAVLAGDRAHRFLALLGAGYGALVIVILLVANWSVALQVQQPHVVMAGQRYSVAPVLFLSTAIAAGLDVLPRPAWARNTVLIARIAVAAVLLAAIGLQVRIGERLTGTSWATAVAAARQDCARGAPAGRLVQEPAGWFFELPCQRF